MRNDQLTVMQIIRNLDIGGAQEVVRTLADLAGRDGPVGEEDLCLALQLRAEPSALGVAA